MLRLRARITPLLLGLCCFLIYNANLRTIGSGDTLPARYLPLILCHDGTLALDASARLVAHGHPLNTYRNRSADAGGTATYLEPGAYWMVRTREHRLASLYPVVTPLLVAPLYLPVAGWLEERGWQQPEIDRAAELMEKISASLLASLASVLMYLVLRRECGRWTLPLALAFAFGTNTWMISSQALWQHGTGELLIALALLLAAGGITPTRVALLGATCVFMSANRPPDALVAGAFALFAVWKNFRNALWLVAGAAIPLAGLVYLNLHFLGHYAGGYALALKHADRFFKLDWEGVPGLLVSPARGLLVFSPFLIFLPMGLLQRMRSPGSKILAAALSIAVAAQIFLYSLTDWRAGESWGPRYLTDILPVLVWLLAPALPVLRPPTRTAFMLTAAASVAVQVIGAFWYTKTSDEIIYTGDPASKRAAWDPRNLPFLIELRHPPAQPELLSDAHGSLDRAGQALVHRLDEVPRLETGAVLEGWALTGGRSPAQLLVLVDGVVVASTAEFLPRPDVNETMHTASPSGWRAFASTRGVPPGERVLQLAVRVGPRSDFRIIREQRVQVIAPETPREITAVPQKPVTAAELDAMAARAASLLRERQGEHGYWLTTHTKGITYKKPQPEMNTYVTAVLVDLLSPIAGTHGLAETVARARRHLAAQIEGNGLVRYHGLPDAPTIGTLGIAITPDSDDTALAWRIAGPGAGDPRLRQALDVLARYRDARGFYRTWLAPRKEYQGIDPGLDPNPTDLAIQMHVYLMLREFDPPAAEQLSRAMQRSFHDSDVWVYYAKAPLVPYLRTAELRQLGCDIPLPSERLASPAAGQEIWSEAARRLVGTTALPGDAEQRQAIRNLLGRIGGEDFALLRQSPPLLYHNDLNASVSRYYWSEDFGYALWLRLYDAAGAGTGQPREKQP